MGQFRDFADQRISKWSSATRWKKWNIQCLVLHELLEEKSPKYDRGVAKDNHSFVIIPKIAGQQLNGYDTNDNDVIFSGDFNECVSFLDKGHI